MNKESLHTLAPNIITEQVGDVKIGREVFTASSLESFRPNNFWHDVFNTLNAPQEMDSRRTIFLSSLNNNTPSTDPLLGHERGVSAYFTYNPHERVVILEWGTIDLSTKEAKLHWYLNKVIDYPDRVKQGMKLSSGHIAKSTQGDHYFALLDSLSKDHSLRGTEEMGEMINTLYQNGFIPITAEGFVKLPAF